LGDTIAPASKKNTKKEVDQQAKVFIINLFFFFQFFEANIFPLFAKSPLEFSAAYNQNSADSAKNFF